MVRISEILMKENRRLSCTNTAEKNKLINQKIGTSLKPRFVRMFNVEQDYGLAFVYTQK